MPLEESASKEAFQHNIEKEIAAGKPQAQAVAIAYSEQRKAKDNKESARKEDTNGWIEIKNNPLSRVGVFPYSGATVGGDPSKVYRVYRPEEELSRPETIESFKLLPWVDDHPSVLLGDSDEGLTPAEKKGIQGVIGEDVYFKDGILYGNIKMFSETLANLIDSGKKQLSVGYQCAYEIVSGIWNGIPYDAIQRGILGNHLALVQEGRMGKQVAVLDSHYTFDSIEITKELKMAEEVKKEEEKKDGMDARLSKVLDWAEAKMAKDAAEEGEKKVEEEKSAKDGLINKVTGVDSEEEEKEEKEKKDGMDAALKSLTSEIETLKKGGIKTMLAEISARDALAKKISVHVGTFDCADKTLSEVAAYGVEKLGINCPTGAEEVALNAFLQARTISTATFGLDSTNKTGGKLDAIVKKYK